MTLAVINFAVRIFIFSVFFFFVCVWSTQHDTVQRTCGTEIVFYIYIFLIVRKEEIKRIYFIWTLRVILFPILPTAPRWQLALGQSTSRQDVPCSVFFFSSNKKIRLENFFNLDWKKERIDLIKNRNWCHYLLFKCSCLWLVKFFIFPLSTDTLSRRHHNCSWLVAKSVCDMISISIYRFLPSIERCLQAKIKRRTEKIDVNLK